MTTKVCFKCNCEKSLTDDFYKHPQTADGYLNKCKECTLKDTAANYMKNRGHYCAYERLRSKSPERKKAAAENQKRQRANYPEKFKARYLLGNALRDGRIVRQPCQVCGDLNSEGHHPDYSEPLKVEWLCITHHGRGNQHITKEASIAPV